MSPSNMMRLQILFLAPLFFLPAIDVIISPAHEQWKYEKAEELKTASRLVQYVAESDGQLIEQARLLLTALSKSSPVMREDSQSCHSLFADILKEQPFFGNIGAADLNGDVFCNAAGSTSTNIAGSDYFQKAVRTRRLVVSDYAPARTTGGHSIDLVYPYFSETGQPKGVIFATLDLKALVRTPLDSLPENSALMITDSKGTIIARYPNVDEWIGRQMPDAPVIKTMLSQKEGSVLEIDLDGVVRDFAFASVTNGSSAELHIAAGIPGKAFNWLKADMLKNAATLFGIIVLFAFAAGWLAVRFIPEEK